MTREVVQSAVKCLALIVFSFFRVGVAGGVAPVEFCSHHGAAQHPDVILMDIQLPLLDGYEATRRIKADPALRHIPIIVVTSYALGGDEAKALAAGCDAYMAKPYSPKALLAKVREYAR